MSAAEQRRQWAQGILSRATGDVPEYMSDEWVDLPDGPEKVAAVVRAAECWAVDCELRDLEQLVFLNGLRHAHKRDEDAAFVARGSDHKQQWTGRGFRPSPSVENDVRAGWGEWVQAG
ncbi:hypothetical protein [Nocardioides dongxiaopingii]|uniref:hypothetical protein n=1 Tax=Nocardioides dongxiaopingii TaxID=2576036 RepID=UPI0010C770F8|nr:hypothetical protein [Nocardioides dongxiaopingii]